jgi:hypothetical protein
MNKICKRCEVSKPLDQYYSHPRALDGVDTKCKLCAKKYMSDRRKSHGDYIRDLEKKSYIKNKVAKIEGCKKWRKENPDKVKQIYRKYRNGNRVKINVLNRKYRDNLSDGYISRLLVEKSNHPRTLISNELIEVKRIHIKLKRKIHENQQLRS